MSALIVTVPDVTYAMKENPAAGIRKNMIPAVAAEAGAQS